jgi:hypothetical protein
MAKLEQSSEELAAELELSTLGPPELLAGLAIARHGDGRGGWAGAGDWRATEIREREKNLIVLARIHCVKRPAWSVKPIRLNLDWQRKWAETRSRDRCMGRITFACYLVNESRRAAGHLAVPFLPTVVSTASSAMRRGSEHTRAHVHVEGRGKHDEMRGYSYSDRKRTGL